MPFVPTIGGNLPFLFTPQDCTFQQALNADFEIFTTVTAYTPVATSQGGAIGSYTSSGSFVQAGKLCTGTANVTVTSVGTATGILFISLPQTAATGFVAIGREISNTGRSLTGTQSGTVMSVLNYDNSAVWSAGANLECVMTFTYLTT